MCWHLRCYITLQVNATDCDKILQFVPPSIFYIFILVLQEQYVDQKCDKLKLPCQFPPNPCFETRV